MRIERRGLVGDGAKTTYQPVCHHFCKPPSHEDLHLSTFVLLQQGFSMPKDELAQQHPPFHISIVLPPLQEAHFLCSTAQK
jgi:hypothetical protein